MMRYRIRLFQDGKEVRSQLAPSAMDDILVWFREWEFYQQLTGDWEVRITPEESE